jgi:fatty acid-binding protein DegV
LAEKRLDGKKMEEAAIIEIDCEQDCVRLEKMVQERFNPRIIFTTAVSPVVGTIVGPGSIGLAYYAE